MSHTITRAGIVSVLEHTIFVIFGLVLMVIGLAMGVTMVLLPAGLVIGFLGLGMFVTGLFARLSER